LHLWDFLPILQLHHHFALIPMTTYRVSIPCSKKRIPATYIRSIAATLLFFVFINNCWSQCTPPSMVFANPELVNGVPGEVGCTYRFSNVAPGLDCHIRIVAFGNGAQLGEIDNTTQGYFDAWQPYVTAAANDTSYLDWLITFKVAGTVIDSVLPCFAITAVDVDGDNASLKEFIRAATPGAYAVDPFTVLTVTFDGLYNSAYGQITTIPAIDTNHREAMFQMNFSNKSALIYRNGAISTKGTPDVRHTCIYFKPFFHETLVILPVKLQSFSATVIDRSTRLAWMVQDESSMYTYEVQRSTDGINWTGIDKVFAVNMPGHNSYYVYDEQRPNGIAYYRLQLTDNSGRRSYSTVVQAGNNAVQALSVKTATIVQKSLSLQVNSPVADAYVVRLYTMQGQLVTQKQFVIAAGMNQLTAELPQVSEALYILTITNRQGHLIYTNKMLRKP
jgi:hypothetical protein